VSGTRPPDVGPDHLDAVVDRWARAGLAEGARAMGAMLGVGVEVQPATASGTVRIADLGAGGSGVPDTCIRVSLGGDLRGELHLLVPDRDALVAPLSIRDHLVDSAVDEVANIVASHFVVGVSRLEAADGLGALGSANLEISPPERWSLDGAEPGPSGHVHHRSLLQAHVGVGVVVVVRSADIARFIDTVTG
jgi:hypothetical protein